MIIIKMLFKNIFVGTPSQCDGNSPNYCCSKFGFCGPGADHCDCVGCIGISPILEKNAFEFKMSIDFLFLFFLRFQIEDTNR